MQGVLVTDTEKLALLLREIVLECPLQQINQELADQAVTYWIYFKDGTRRSVTAYDSVVILDGGYWQCRNVPSEELNQYVDYLKKQKLKE